MVHLVDSRAGQIRKSGYVFLFGSATSLEAPIWLAEAADPVIAWSPATQRIAAEPLGVVYECLQRAELRHQKGRGSDGFRRTSADRFWSRFGPQAPLSRHSGLGRGRPNWVETRPSALPPLGRLINPCAEVIFNTAESRQ